MKAVIVATLLATAVFTSADATGLRIPAGSKPGGCHIPPKVMPNELIKTARPHEYIKKVDVPRDFAWSNVNGTSYLTPSRNQHIPQYCGSCWAMGSTVALADRIKIKRQTKFPDYMLAVQTMVYCLCDGCMGGNAYVVYDYAATTGIPADTCQNYISQGTGSECSAIHTCQNCDPATQQCYAITNYTNFKVSEHGRVLGVDNMKAEILARGPIACGIDAPPIYEWGFGADAKKVFTAGVGQTNIDHIISVVGWGYDATQNVNYWTIRNSWGEYWADNGFFRLAMGQDQLGLESYPCSWAVPIIPESIAASDASKVSIPNPATHYMH